MGCLFGRAGQGSYRCPAAGEPPGWPRLGSGTTLIAMKQGSTAAVQSWPSSPKRGGQLLERSDGATWERAVRTGWPAMLSVCACARSPEPSGPPIPETQQTGLRVSYSSGGVDGFGDCVRTVEDVDGDGFVDLIIGATQADCGADELDDDGQVSLFSGRTGDPIWTACGLGFSGSNVCILGDIDSDGVRDLLVDGDIALVLSGKTGAVIRKHPSARGEPIAATADLTGDGIGDYVIGHVSASNSLLLISGQDGETARSIDIAPYKASHCRVCSRGLCFVDDIDGDRSGDIVVAIATEGEADHVSDSLVVVSGKTGQLIYQSSYYPSRRHSFGMSLCQGSDWNVDGVRDIMVGVPWGNADGNGESRRGYVLVVSGRDGDVITRLDGLYQDDGFGSSIFVSEKRPSCWIEGASVAVGANRAGRVLLFALPLVESTHQLRGAPFQYLGSCIAAGDFDRDGCDDIVVGCADPVEDEVRPGEVLVYSGKDYSLMRVFR